MRSRNWRILIKETKLIEPEYVQPIQGLKINHLGSRNPRLHSNEILIALAISAMSNEDAKLAMQELGKLKGSEAHSTVMLTGRSTKAMSFASSGINVTMDPVHNTIACSGTHVEIRIDLNKAITAIL